MKRLFLICSILLSFMGCKEDETNISGVVIDIHSKILFLTDSNLNDRLNPESECYVGDDFLKGIELYYQKGGKRYVYYPEVKYTNEDGVEKGWYVVYPPYEDTAEHGRVKLNTVGYYHIGIPAEFETYENHSVAYTYIVYPDGTEDEIKMQLYVNENRNHLFIDLIWLNGELIYSMVPEAGSSSEEYYCSPEHFPFSEPGTVTAQDHYMVIKK